jgi:hypothetical protein
MPQLTIKLDGDGCWPDLNSKGWTELQLKAMAYLPKGTVGGMPTITMRLEDPQGKIFLAETTVNLLLTAAAAFRGKAEHDGVQGLA